MNLYISRAYGCIANQIDSILKNIICFFLFKNKAILSWVVKLVQKFLLVVKWWINSQSSRAIDYLNNKILEIGTEFHKHPIWSILSLTVLVLIITLLCKIGIISAAVLLIFLLLFWYYQTTWLIFGMLSKINSNIPKIFILLSTGFS